MSDGTEGGMAAVAPPPLPSPIKGEGERAATNRVGWAALCAANEAMPNGTREIIDLIVGEGGEPDDFDKMAAFVRIAGDIGGEPLFRWMAGRALHPLPADGFASTDPAVRLWFDAFVATARALWPIVDPKSATVPVTPVLGHDRAERVESGERLPRDVPTTTAGIAVVRNYDPTGAVAAAPGANVGAVIGAAALADFASGKIPTQAELLAMTPEERRGYAHLFGMGSDVAALEAQLTDPEARLGAAPAADADSLHKETVDRDGVKGAVAVGKVKKGGSK